MSTNESFKAHMLNFASSASERVHLGSKTTINIFEIGKAIRENYEV